MKELDGACVLLLEDEFLIALDAEQILKELGVREVQTVANLADAEQRVQQSRFDLALLDVNINGQMSFDLAHKLRERGIPVVFATGYELRDRAHLDAEAGIYVSKPYTTERLREALLTAIESARPT